MLGWVLIFAFLGAGWVLQWLLALPVPGNVLGLLLLLAALVLGWVRLEWVEAAATFLLRHMLLFFAPLIASVVWFGPRLGAEWPAVAAGLLGATLAVLLCTAWTMRRLIRS